MGINGGDSAVPDQDVHDPVMTVRIHDMAAFEKQVHIGPPYIVFRQDVTGY